MAGTYDGYVYSVQYQSASPSFYISDTVFSEFTIEREGKYIVVLGVKIHEDSLADGEHVYTNGDCSSLTKVYGDTISADRCYYWNPFAYKFSGCYGVKVSN
ncbi:MAG: hypothetical protein IPM77_03045 [Crocinitomicaceae bacterium]|nr:hypothetical protein [Crocinitomicaceae bacterium]